MSNEILFFASKSDIEAVLQNIESAYLLKYVRCGLFDNEYVKVYDSALDIEGLGYSESGNVSNQSYLVLERTTPLNIRSVPQQRGGVKYAIDQMENKTSFIFAPGGLYRDEYIIFGRISTVNSVPEELKVFKEFTKKMIKMFSKVGRYYIGPEAKLLSNERRLITINANQSIEYDLKLLK
ncbi:hypothetical protein [Paenibacillus terrigena]|uniref:hypothetical protein n=1 Tax=Paenibacillus terrigena TaxID=369333 RepID=UPI00035CBB64|nr:hypothetical protein [Paenibacillus terrigena]